MILLFIDRNDDMLEKLKQDLYDSFKVILPIVIIISILGCFIYFPLSLLLSFLFSSFLLILGIGLFTFGADLSMMIIGERLGNKLVKSKKIWIILLVSFIIGTIVTIAEPDLKVLADQVISIPSGIMILTISIGVGISLLLSSMRTIYGWNLNNMLFIGYTVVLILIFFVPGEFAPVAFDSGGITIGTISIPFIMTLGIGLAANRIDSKAKEDSFGLVALCSIGPIITVLLLGLFYDFSGNYNVSELIRTEIVYSDYINQMVISARDVLTSILPIIAVFIFFQVFSKDMSKKEIRKILFGLFIMIIGLVLFFVAANVGFMDMGYYLGETLASNTYKYLLIPVVVCLSYFISIAEPAVQILNDQVEEITEGSISKRAMNISLALGVCISTALSIIRILTGTSFLYYIIPGQILALVLMFFTPKIFTSIAFDAGGATGGTLTAAFLLPITIGICMATNSNILANAFGLAALISLAPLITIQIVGIIYSYKSKQFVKIEDLDDSIVDFELEGLND